MRRNSERSEAAYEYGNCGVIILNRDFLPIGIFYEDAPPVLVHASYLAHDHGGILLTSQNLPDWGTDLSRRKHCCRHLIEQRLKQVVIRAVN
jgi:hypothetical protein